MIELYKDGEIYVIRKGTMRINCACSDLTKKDLERLYTKIGRVLGKVD